MNNIINLTDLDAGDTAIVGQLLPCGDIRRRLLDMGLIEGTRVECVMKSPGGDPIAYLIRGAVIALRNEDAENVIVSV